MRLDQLTEPALITPRLDGTDRPTVLRALAELMSGRTPIEVDDLYRKLEQREALGSTAIGNGVAVPHCKTGGLERVLMAIGITADAIDFGADDQAPVRVFFLVVSPERQPAAHLKCLAAISRWVRDPEHVASLIEMPDAAAVFDALRADAERAPSGTS